MGEVFAAEDERLKRAVAIKLLPSDFSADAARRARFEREAKLLASLSHPGIVTVHDHVLPPPAAEELDRDGRSSRRARRAAAAPDAPLFAPTAWSSDGTRLVGCSRGNSNRLNGWIYHLSTRRFEKLTDDGYMPQFIDDDHLDDVVGNEVRVIDLKTRRAHVALSLAPDIAGTAIFVADGFLYYTRDAEASDLWMATLQP